MFKIRKNTMEYSYYLCNSQNNERLNIEEIAELSKRDTAVITATLIKNHNGKLERDQTFLFEDENDVKSACEYLNSILILDKLTN